MVKLDVVFSAYYAYQFLYKNILKAQNIDFSNRLCFVLINTVYIKHTFKNYSGDSHAQLV